jgi:MFS family permease
MPPRRIFYGWYVVAAICLITTTTSGLAFYNLSVLLAAFTAERGFPVALASSATATFFIAGGIGGIIAGRLVDRIDPRIVIGTSATLGALTLATAGLLRETWQLYLFHAVFGLCHGGGGLVPVTTLVARWFNKRRALAFSLASTGLSLGGMFIAPFAALAVERLGLAEAAPWMGIAFFLGIVPVTILVLRASPRAMGLEADGVSQAQAAANLASGPTISFAEAWRSRFFVTVSVAYLFLLGAQVGAIAHFYRLASTRDGVATAALALATMASFSTIGRLLGGWLLLKVPARTFALALMLVQAASLAFLAVAEDRVMILAGAVMFGITIGNSLMMQPLLLAERFGTRDYGRIYSSSQFVTVVGVAGCPALIGLLYETSGGYAAPFLTVAGLTLLGYVVLLVFSTATRKA